MGLAVSTRWTDCEVVAQNRISAISIGVKNSGIKDSSKNKTIVAEVNEAAGSALSAVIADYRGLTVE